MVQSSSTPTSVAQFPTKLYDMLCDASQRNFEHIVSWLPGGKEFRIHDPKAMEREILGTYFNQSKYKSFLRQLQNYGFARCTKGPEKGLCRHKDFIKGQRILCQQMRRVSPSSRKSSAPLIKKKLPETISAHEIPDLIPSSFDLPIKLVDMIYPPDALNELPSLVAATKCAEVMFPPEIENLIVCGGEVRTKPESGMFEGRKFFLIL